jgi:hypothetical protein
MAEQLLDGIDLDGIPPDIIDAADLSMPGEFMDGAMAVDMVGYLRQYHTLDFQQTAARHQEDHKHAEEIGKNKLWLKTIIGYVQWKHPRSKAIADKMMMERAQKEQLDNG